MRGNKTEQQQQIVIVMDLTANKALALVLLGVIKLVSGLAPLVLTKLLKRIGDRFLKKFIGELYAKQDEGLI